jgi:hypothetical protein
MSDMAPFFYYGVLLLGIVSGLWILVEMLLKRFGPPAYYEWFAKCRRVPERPFAFLVELSIWGTVVWLFAQSLTSKPLAALTLADLGWMIFWLCLVIVVGWLLLRNARWRN